MSETTKKTTWTIPIHVMQALDYEIRSSWWLGHAWWLPGGREIIGWWFGRKAARRHRRYMVSKWEELAWKTREACKESESAAETATSTSGRSA